MLRCVVYLTHEQTDHFCLGRETLESHRHPFPRASPWEELRLRFRLLTPNVELPEHIYRSWDLESGARREEGTVATHSGRIQCRAGVSVVLFSSVQSVMCSVCFCCSHGELTPKRADKRRIRKSTPPGSLWVSVNHTGTRAFCLLLKV